MEIRTNSFLLVTQNDKRYKIRLQAAKITTVSYHGQKYECRATEVHNNSAEAQVL